MTPEMLSPLLAAPLAPAPEDHPELDDIEVEDGKPLDSLFQEKLHRLLTESLFASWPGPGEGRPFRVFSNVGLFFAPKEPPLVPDVMLRLDVPPESDLKQKKNRSYFIWIVGKPPDVVIEFVSDKRGGEATTKFAEYAALGVPYYAIFDPEHELSKDTLKIYRLVRKAYQPLSGNQLDGIGLGLVLWQGKYEGRDDTWLRWCDPSGVVIPTGKERGDTLEQRAETLAQRADRSEGRAERLAARLRELGIDPDAINGT
jgi:Uma2 family endonuclease